jgi:hypothetical protein
MAPQRSFGKPQHMKNRERARPVQRRKSQVVEFTWEIWPERSADPPLARRTISSSPLSLGLRKSPTPPIGVPAGSPDVGCSGCEVGADGEELAYWVTVENEARVTLQRCCGPAHCRIGPVQGCGLGQLAGSPGVPFVAAGLLPPPSTGTTSWPCRFPE